MSIAAAIVLIQRLLRRNNSPVKYIYAKHNIVSNMLMIAVVTLSQRVPVPEVIKKMMNISKAMPSTTVIYLSN